MKGALSSALLLLRRTATGQFVKYVLVQVVLVALDYALYVTAVFMFGVPATAAFVMCRLIGAVLSYIAHAKITFGSNEKHSVAALRFAALVAVNIAIGSLIVARLVATGGSLWAKVAADVSLLVFNFLVSRAFIFTRR